MSKRILSILLAISIVACIFSGLTFSVLADTENGYYYSVSNDKATITGINEDIVSGDITIPSTLGGYPVTILGSNAFD